MATLSEMKQVRDIKYISKDFDALVKELKNYIKYQFPDSYQDFSDTSGGMAFLELVAYVGDILNFYIDKQFGELFLDTAKERKNLINLAKNLGYKIRGKAASEVELSVEATYPLTGAGTADVSFKLLKETQVTTSNGTRFIVSENINFAEDSRRVITTNAQTNTTLAVVNGIKATNGEIRKYDIHVTDPIPFLRITLPDPDVLEIISITSSDGYSWYEAEYLAQETQFYGVQNVESTSSTIPYILTLRQIPRRFVTEKDDGGFMTLTFGAGSFSTSDEDFIPNPSDYVLPTTVRGAEGGITINSIDPENFLATGTLGATPRNVTLSVKYRIGGGIITNVTSRLINSFYDKQIQFLTAATLSANQKQSVTNSLRVYNLLPASGGLNDETNREIREYAGRSFASQNRAVTIQDYVVRTMTIPPQFGSPFRVYARKDPNTDYGIEIAILTKNSDNTLAKASDRLKINIGNYLARFKHVSDDLNIIDGKIVNIKVEFSIVANKKYNSDVVLANCLLKLKDYFNINNWQFGESISKSDIQSVLHNINGVDSVTKVEIFNLYDVVNGNTYSDTRFNVNFYTVNNIITIDADSIFEVKYPELDLLGSVLN